MARALRDSQLETRAARHRLKPRGKPYWRLIEEGLHLGYRKPRGRRGRPVAAGKWVVRHYIGEQSYQLETIAEADDFSDPDGSKILSFSQAQELARGRAKQRGSVDGSRGPLTVSAAIKDYLSYLEGEGRSAENVRDAQYRANAFISPELGELEVSGLTTNRLRRWRDSLAKMQPRLRTAKGEKQKHREATGAEDGRRRRASANRTWTVLRAALNHAFREGRVHSDVEWRRIKPFRETDAARTRYLTIAEAKRLINASDADFRKLVQAALQTGARYSELTRLNVSDYNPDAGTVLVRESKSGKPRHINLTDEGKKFFGSIVTGRDGAKPLLKPANGERWGKSQQTRPMQDAVNRAKIKPAISFHGLRHTWASHAVMNGTPLMVVAKNLGHADTRMVERHYGHLAPSYVAEAIRAGAPRFGFRASRKVVQLGQRS